MSVICRKEKYLKTNTLSFYGKWVTDNKCRDFVGNHVGDFKGGKKRFGGNGNNRYYKV